MSSRVIRTVVVDDEADARDLLQRRLQAERDIEIVAICASGRSALAAIERHDPDLLLLDIQMPGLSGLDLLSRIAGRSTPYVICVTAYDQYAVRAYEHAALDYLLKPLSRDRFRTALDRARQQLALERRARKLPSRRELQRLWEFAGEGPDDATEQRDPRASQLVIPTERGFRSVAVSDIQAIEADDHYSQIHVGSRSHFYPESLGTVANKLDPRVFIRIHRSTIVNLAAVVRVRTHRFGSLTVVLANKSRWQVSRGRRQAFETALMHYNSRR